MRPKVLKDVNKYKPDLLRRCIYPFYSLFCHIWVFFFTKKPKYDKKYKFSIVTIFKNEAPFFAEWIEFNRIVGAEHFYLYNNNSEDNYLEVLQPYIDEGLVTLTDCPDKPGQLVAYTHWYNNFRYESQWVSFLDADEFFCPKYTMTVTEWLKRYEKYPVVSIYWRFFGTSGLLKHKTDQLVTEQYHVCYEPLIEPGKVLYNTDYDISQLFMAMMHGFNVKVHGLSIPPINEYKSFIRWTMSRVGHKESTMQINHYWSKALDIYQGKMARGSATRNVQWKKMDTLLRNESYNYDVDYRAYRFIIRLKLALKEQSINLS